MAVVHVFALKRGRSGSVEFDKSKRTYTQLFLVQTDDPADGPQVARTAIDPNGGPVIPQPGTFYIAGNDLDLGCYISNVHADQLGDSGLLWEVTVTAESFSDEPPKPQQDPTMRPPEVSWSTAPFQKVAEKDTVTGKPVANSAKKPFDPPVQVDDLRPVYVCTRNEGNFNRANILLYKDAVNTDAITLDTLPIAPGQAKICSIQAQRQYDNNQIYHQVTYEIHVSQDGWKESLLDIGLMQLDGTPCVDRNGEPATEPCWLDGSGNQVPWANIKAGASPSYVTYNVYPQVPFTPLQLP